MNDIRYATETYDDVIADLRPLLDEHWREIALNPDIPLDPNYEMYAALGKTDRMLVFTVRCDTQLIGYAVYFANRHPHYKNHTWALSDLFWIHPAHRSAGVGRGLFQHIEAVLYERGVAVMHTTIKVAHPMARTLLESLGHSMIEWGFSKRLDRG